MWIVVVVVVVATIVAIALRPFKMCVDFGIKYVILFTFVYALVEPKWSLLWMEQ